MNQHKPDLTVAAVVEAAELSQATSSSPSRPLSIDVPSGASRRSDQGFLTPGQREAMKHGCERMIALDHRSPTGRQLRRRQAKLARKLGLRK